MFEEYIGKKVVKISGKPFKSSYKANTVKDVVEHPLGKPAFSFEEDDSIVEAWRCRLVGE